MTMETQPKRPGKIFLGTVNGLGARFFGERDRQADGSYVTTRCLVVMWIPVLPIDSWRVRKHRDPNMPTLGGLYEILERVPTSPGTRKLRTAILLATAAFVALVTATVRYQRPSARFDRAWASAEEATSGMPPDRAIRVLTELLNENSSAEPEQIRMAALRIADLSLQGISAPLDADDAARAMAAANRVKRLPGAARAEATGVVIARIEQVADEGVRQSPEAAPLGAQMIDAALVLAEGSSSVRLRAKRQGFVASPEAGTARAAP